MNRRNLLAVALLAFVVGCGERMGPEQQPPPTAADEGTPTPPPSETAAPAKAPSGDEPMASPTTGAKSETDRELTSAVRKVIDEDPSLSPAARTITIAAADGVVTLQGKVPTEAEKQAIEDRVKAVPGVRNVDNQLEVG
jgi:hypothetical protein